MMRSVLLLWILSLLCLSVFAQPDPQGGPPFGATPNSVASTSTKTNKSTTTKTKDTKTTNTKTADTKATDAEASKKGATKTGSELTKTDTARADTAVSGKTSSTTATSDAGAAGAKSGKSSSTTDGGNGVNQAANTLATSSSTTTGLVATNTLNASPSTASLTKDAKLDNEGNKDTLSIGLGVGLGVGIPLIIGAAALIFFLRRRRASHNYRSSGTSAAHLREQPAMASGAPALAGMSEMGRSPSKYSLPHTPSQHSLVAMPEDMKGPANIPPPQHELSRGLSQHSAVSRGYPEQEYLMPALPPYEDAPSPMDEHEQGQGPLRSLRTSIASFHSLQDQGHDEPPSPVSPISPMGSRPPSPLNDHER